VTLLGLINLFGRLRRRRRNGFVKSPDLPGPFLKGIKAAKFQSTINETIRGL